MYPSLINKTYGVFVKNFVEQMIAIGFEVTPMVINGRGRTMFEKLCKYLVFLYQATTALNKGKYDLIYVHYIGHSLIPFLFLKNGPSCSLVVNAHGGDVFTTTRLGRLIQKLVSPVIRKADLVVVPSAYFSEVVSHKFSISANRIFVSPSGGVDGQLFQPETTISKSSLFTVGYVSRIDEGKGWDVLLLAIDRLLKAGVSNFQVLMVGGGAQVQQLRAMLKSLNLGEYVCYVGPVSYQELPHYYRQMDVFVFPTTRLAESLGLVGLEALACGVPVLGSDIGGLPSYIKADYNGKIFPPRDSEQLAQYLKEMMLLDPVELNSLKHNAIESAKPYDSILVRQKMKEKLEQVIADFSKL